ncbi:MAG: glycoside hydrolase family 5 protein [Clostridiales bacterium]|nr:glycoside hydrolase family 5 protein [Clostridiales bacterium]
MTDTMHKAVRIPTLENIPVFSAPDNEALRFVRQIRLGWNLGNTLDATRRGQFRDEMAIEASWCGCFTTPEMIQQVKDAGFNAIRVPVSWHNHVNSQDFTISPRWLDRVQEVVDYAISRDLYVIINTHHDESPDYFYPAQQHMETSRRFVAAIWAQLAQRFQAYDHKLIFECLNEPRQTGTPYEWGFKEGVAEYSEAVGCINELNQLFVDTIRAADGYNADRFLMVSSYAATPDATISEQFVLPKDALPHRLIVSAHAYTPYPFALQGAGGVSVFRLDERSSTTPIDKFMDGLFNRFVANGVPVILGEFGARNKDNLQDRVDFAAYYIANATARSMPCFWWDNNAFTGQGETFGLLNRRSLSWTWPEIVQAMLQYCGFDEVAE